MESIAKFEVGQWPLLLSWGGRESEDIVAKVAALVTLRTRGTYCQGYLGFAKMYLELLELLLELLLQLLLELLLLLLLSWLPRAR